MFKKTLFLSSAFLAACGGGMTEDQYADKMIAASCDKIFECTTAEEIEAAGEFWIFGDSSADCQALFDTAQADDTGGSESTCDFNAEAASACVDETEAMTCEEYAAGTVPDVCADVCDIVDTGPAVSTDTGE